MFKIGDKVKVIDDGYEYNTYTDFFMLHSIENLIPSYSNKYVDIGTVGTIKFIGTHPNEEKITLVVFSTGDKLYLIEDKGLKLLEKNYNLKAESIAQKISTNNFEVELWKTDSTYSLYFDKTLMVEMLDSEDIDELIFILQEAKRLNNQ